MTLITFEDGKPILKDGKVGTEQACCCEQCSGDCVCFWVELSIPIGGNPGGYRFEGSGSFTSEDGELQVDWDMPCSGSRLIGFFQTVLTAEPDGFFIPVGYVDSNRIEWNLECGPDGWGQGTVSLSSSFQEDGGGAGYESACVFSATLLPPALMLTGIISGSEDCEQFVDTNILDNLFGGIAGARYCGVCCLPGECRQGVDAFLGDRSTYNQQLCEAVGGTWVSGDALQCTEGSWQGKNMIVVDCENPLP